MKFLTVILTISICVFLGAQSAPTSNLLEELKELNELFYRDEIKQVIRIYYENDPEVRKIFQYVRSPEVNAIGNEFVQKPEVREFGEWLFDKIRSRKSTIPSNMYNDDVQLMDQFTGGWNAFVQDFLHVFSIQEYKDKVEELKAKDEDFAELIQKLADLKPVYDKFVQEPQVIELGKKLRGMGVDVKQLDSFLRELNGWN